MDHVELALGSPHDPRRRLELRRDQLSLAVRALLQRELVLQGGELHLAVGQERLPHHDGQQRDHDHGDRHDGEEPSPTGGGAAPSNAAPGARWDDPERSAPGRRSFGAPPRTAGRVRYGASCGGGGVPAD